MVSNSWMVAGADDPANPTMQNVVCSCTEANMSSNQQFALFIPSTVCAQKQLENSAEVRERTSKTKLTSGKAVYLQLQNDLATGGG